MPTSASVNDAPVLPPPAYHVVVADTSHGLRRTASWPGASRHGQDNARAKPPSPDKLQHMDGIGLLTASGRTLKAQAGALIDLPAPEAPSRWARFKRACSKSPRLRTADSLHDILRAKVIDANTTVILDVDRTVIRPIEGSYPASKSLWVAHTETVEPDTTHVVNALQDCGVPIFGLTARGLGRQWETATCTEHQLRSVGVAMHRTSPLPNMFDFDLRHRAGSRHGVAYCGHNTKGDVLARILQLRPQAGRFVLIDDGLHNFPSLFDAARACNIDLTCVYYRHDLEPLERAADTWDAFLLQNVG